MPEVVVGHVEQPPIPSGSRRTDQESASNTRSIGQRRSPDFTENSFTRSHRLGTREPQSASRPQRHLLACFQIGFEDSFEE